MKLSDILDIYYGDEFILFTENQRIGKFKEDDKGIEEYMNCKVKRIEPNINGLIAITL